MKKKKWPQNEGGLEKKLGDPSGSNGVPSKYGNTNCGVFNFYGYNNENVLLLMPVRISKKTSDFVKME